MSGWHSADVETTEFGVDLISDLVVCVAAELLV